MKQEKSSREPFLNTKFVHDLGIYLKSIDNLLKERIPDNYSTIFNAGTQTETIIIACDYRKVDLGGVDSRFRLWFVEDRVFDVDWYRNYKEPEKEIGKLPSFNQLWSRPEKEQKDPRVKYLKKPLGFILNEQEGKTDKVRATTWYALISLLLPGVKSCICEIREILRDWMDENYEGGVEYDEPEQEDFNISL